MTIIELVRGVAGRMRGGPAEEIIFSRFPDTMTEDAKPLEPPVVFMSAHLGVNGMVIVYRWRRISGDVPLDQSPPEFVSTLSDAEALVPKVAVEEDCPPEFGLRMWRVP